jgi:hypothetical protein
MAISNTSVLIKRSTTTGTPSTLKAGELAYSYLSNTIFIGTSSGTGVINVGGQYYTSQIDNATSTNTSSTIVKRDASGNISVGYIIAAGISVSGLTANTANLAAYATQLQTPQYFGAYGDATAANVIFNGTANVELGFTLATVNSNVGAYGNTTSVPTITVDAKGRITSISNNTIATSFTVLGNTGSGTQAGAGTLTLEGNGTGITTTVTGSGGSETVLFATDSTVARTNVSTVGAQVFNTDINLPTNNMSVGGTLNVTNLFVSGNLIQTNATQTLNVNDPMIYLASNNSSDVVDIGIVGHFVGPGNSGFSHYQHLGFVRDYNDRKWKLFSNVSTEPTSTVVFDANTIYDTIKVGGVDVSTGNITAVNSISANTLSLTNALTVANGGTGATTFQTGSILVGNNTGALTVLANTGTAGTYGNANTVLTVTTDAYGRVSSIASNPIAINASQIALGQVSVQNGGTGSSSFYAGQILIGNGAGALSQLPNSSFTVTGSTGTNSTLTSLSVDAYGRTTAATFSSISGLTVSQGGTGLSTATTNGITYGNGTGAFGVTSSAGTSDQSWSNQILTVTNLGVPVWSSTMDGGVF